MVSKLLILFLAVCRIAQGISSTNVLGADLTILINNDLLGPQSPSAGWGIILVSNNSQISAVAACTSLGESLWDPDLTHSSIQANLNYLTLQDKYPSDQLYWIATTATAGRAIDGYGRISNSTSLSAHSHLPALCTQSAPFSNISAQDTSLKWQTIVHSNNEYITGFRDRLSFRFLGIRFAPEPKRFAHSSAYQGLGNNASALSYGPQCLQSSGGAEDCLFLNVFTPYLPAHGGTSAKRLKPVMLWIYGGGYTSGTASDPTFDGGNIASRGDVVLVACNYRLGVLGFLALDDGLTTGNYGLGDAINALDWVRRNIHDFGGDPDRITIFGQSAGAASVRAIMASPKAKGKFRAAIPMSNLGGGGYGATYSEWMTIDDAAANYAKPFLQATNCTKAISHVDCLRAIPAPSLLAIPANIRYLVVDGVYLTTDRLPLDASANGSLANVHLLQGLMRDDGAAITTYIRTTNITEAINETGFNTSVVTTSGLFPVPDGANKTLDVFNVTSRAATDTIFRCSDQASAYAGLTNDVFAPNQYFYGFNRSYQTPGWNPNAPVCQPPSTPSHPNGDPQQEYFKCHSGELYYVFGNILRMGYALRDGEADLEFMRYIVDSWTSFARTWDPNPSRGFLEARGYTSTIELLERSGAWLPLGEGVNGIRWLQWPNSEQVVFGDVEQCQALGWGMDMYL